MHTILQQRHESFGTQLPIYYYTGTDIIFHLMLLCHWMLLYLMTYYNIINSKTHGCLVCMENVYMEMLLLHIYLHDAIIR